MNNISSQKFFLYARKSTDVEDKQVLSIEAQLTELRDYAKRENLNIALEFIEKQSAKIPGRPVFNEMMKCIEKGDADSILSWHPDRLARNSIDGGKIIYFLDTGKLASLKFPTFWCDNTSQGKFMLNMAFGQSKYYVDSLSENTKRGLRQKVRNGEYPTLAPVGYINDSRIKSVIVDRKKAKIIKQAFELYVKGNQRLEDIANFLAKKNIISKRGNIIHKSRATSILSNPFYTGLFRYGGELHEGKHEPIISKKLFDQAQEMLKLRGKPDRKAKNEPQSFCGLISCASCGMMITGEYKVKKQKNGNVHEYIYYHCTKKNKSVKEKEEKIQNIKIKLERLLTGYLDQDIEKEIYRAEKSKLLFSKKSLEEEIISLSHKQNAWLEPFQNWVKVAQGLDKIAFDTDLFAKKVVAKEIFGSNLLLGEKPGRPAEGGAPFRPQNSLAKTGETAWALLRNAHSLSSSKPFSSFKVCLLNHIRTYFQNK